MCRCCQNFWEDLYWNCFEEKFCFDESIANYNPEEDEDFAAAQKKGGLAVQIVENNNSKLSPICAQPVRRGQSMLMSNAKIHEEDYRRETQTNVPMLGPEILTVFANSQIFQDHQPTKLNRISTKPSFLPTPQSKDTMTLSLTSNDALALEQSKALQDLEVHGSLGFKEANIESQPEKRITFSMTDLASSQTLSTQTPFTAIEEEYDDETLSTSSAPSISEMDSSNEVILRPRLIDRHPHLLPSHSSFSPSKPTLRSVKSVPHFNFNAHPSASDMDIFAITGTGGPISMTPEVPSISFASLPKNYEDTPTIEKYRVSQSLYSIQTANAAARVTKDDYSMPRYFRRSALTTQSSETLSNAPKDVIRPVKEKNKRLQMLRGNLPPLLIHSVSFRNRNRDDIK